MDKLLLHCCCGPCSMYPISFLKSKNTELDMFWFNPNIHPEFEWKRRLDNLRIVASYYNEELIEVGSSLESYWMDCQFLFSFNSRCEMCYDMRIDMVAEYCASHDYRAFTTTLLVSPYQNHEEIVRIANEKAKKYGTKFEYHDFRDGYRTGQDMAREIGLYRQKYCGCILSLEESKYRDKILKSFEEA